MSWKNILKRSETDEYTDINFKLERKLENWLDDNWDFETLIYMDGHTEDVDGNEELVAEVEFENNSENDLENEEAYEKGEGFFIVQFYTETKREGSPYDIARYNVIHDTGVEVIEAVDVEKIPLHIARKLLK